MNTLRRFVICLIILISSAYVSRAVNDALWMGLEYSVAVKYIGISEENVLMPRPLSVQLPDYPQKEFLSSIQGEVFLCVEIRPDGTVGEVVIEKALNPSFAEAAAKTVKRWSFSPGVSHGSGNAVTTHLHCKIGFYADEK